jgi:hypothetical protein
MSHLKGILQRAVGFSSSQPVIRVRKLPTPDAPRFRPSDSSEVLKQTPRPTVSPASPALSVPLSEPIPGVFSIQQEQVQGEPQVQITVLPNGVRVATLGQPMGMEFCGVGTFVLAGSRLDTPETSGLSHLYERMAFKVCSRLRWRFSFPGLIWLFSPSLRSEPVRKTLFPGLSRWVPTF